MWAGLLLFIFGISTKVYKCTSIVWKCRHIQAHEKSIQMGRAKIQFVDAPTKREIYQKNKEQFFTRTNKNIYQRMGKGKSLKNNFFEKFL